MKKMWWYDALWILTMPVWLAFYIWVKRPGHPGIAQRFGRYPKSFVDAIPSGGRPVWLHAVSVGEVIAAAPLLEALRRKYPKKRWVVSTATPTGQKLARERLPRDVGVFFAPWDIGFCVQRALTAIHPCLFIGMETELWPNLLLNLQAAGVPVAVANGRVSDRAFPRYHAWKALFAPILRGVRFWGMQTLKDAQRIADLGASPPAVHVTGNLKADAAIPVWDDQQIAKLRSGFGLGPQVPLWVAGSTHPGEEEMIVSALRQVQIDRPDLRLMIAPRHPERTGEVESLVRRAGLTPIRRSSMKRQPLEHWQGQAVLLIDTLGELSNLYGLADFVFVGGSLVPRGGHNLLEPAQRSKPILTGPYMHNFQSIFELLQAQDAIRVAATSESLAAEIRRWLRDPGLSRSLGARACAAVRSQAGSAEKTVELLSEACSSVLSDK
ncbi:MAG: 3-deoxy-D-manno-octulosonic acid transferase [Candidatus Omnitrophica bacterium]|nr:3-deoxy-D-manno-octulosonic acid transferase [Candidatus Omnitrophota bacterium]